MKSLTTSGLFSSPAHKLAVPVLANFLDGLNVKFVFVKFAAEIEPAEAVNISEIINTCVCFYIKNTKKRCYFLSSTTGALEFIHL